MSYSISIAGSQVLSDVEAAVAFEQDVVEKVKAFIADLEGVTHAQVVGGQVGTQNLTPAQEPVAEASETTEPAAPATSAAPETPTEPAPAATEEPLPEAPPVGAPPATPTEPPAAS